MILSKFFTLALIALSILSPINSSAEEYFDSDKESKILKNIQQLTSPTMGFEKAGEAYFSPDGQTIIFQAVPTGQEHYQIYTMRLDEKIPRMVSTGIGACTCSNFRPDGKKIIFASSHSDPSLQDLSNELIIRVKYLLQNLFYRKNLNSRGGTS